MTVILAVPFIHQRFRLFCRGHGTFPPKFLRQNLTALLAGRRPSSPRRVCLRGSFVQVAGPGVFDPGVPVRHRWLSVPWVLPLLAAPAVFRCPGFGRLGASFCGPGTFEPGSPLWVMLFVASLPPSRRPASPLGAALWFPVWVSGPPWGPRCLVPRRLRPLAASGRSTAAAIYGVSLLLLCRA